jgi:ribosomal 30S subunit maturation factor RimM
MKEIAPFEPGWEKLKTSTKVRLLLKEYKEHSPMCLGTLEEMQLKEIYREVRGLERVVKRSYSPSKQKEEVVK